MDGAVNVPGEVHCTPDVRQEATGGIEAQSVIKGLAEGALNPLHAWLAFATLAARHGWRSPACMAYVVELAKRAGAAARSEAAD